MFKRWCEWGAKNLVLNKLKLKAKKDNKCEVVLIHIEFNVPHPPHPSLNLNELLPLTA